MLFFLDAITFGAIAIWVMLLMVLGAPTVSKQPYLKARYLMALVPAVIVIVSLIGALLFGVFGPVQRTAPSFVYFYTLYNLYVIILLIGYWPINSAFNRGTKAETTPIFGSDANYSEFSGDKNFMQDSSL